jgi:hypothetical protein
MHRQVQASLTTFMAQNLTHLHDTSKTMDMVMMAVCGNNPPDGCG